MRRSGKGSSTHLASRLFKEEGLGVRPAKFKEKGVPKEILQARTHLIDFTKHCYPRYKDDEAHRLIASTLDDVVDGREDRVMIFAPPQHGKSFLSSVHFPAYWMGRRPNDPIVLCSYGAKLAHHLSRNARGVIQSWEYQQIFPETVISGATKAVDLWELGEEKTGYMTASGVGGPIGGFGGMLGIIDDPFKDFADAYSETMRENIWEWYRSTFLARMWEGNAQLLIMTRWHDDDLAGRLLKSQPGEWKVLRLPALSETQKDRDERNKIVGLPKGLPDPVGRKKKDLPLAPKRFSRKMMIDRREKSGPTAWGSEYQGAPLTIEGNLVQRDSFRIVQAVPAKLKKVRYWDKAATAGGGTWTVGILMGKDEREDAEHTHYLLHMVRGQWGTKARDRIIKQTAQSDEKEWGRVAQRFEVEGGSSGKDVEVDTIRMLEGFDVEGDRPTGDKVTRGIPYARQVEAGNVAILAADWNMVYLDNIVLVPHGGMDEWDSSSGAFNELAKTKKKARARSRV